ncbi:hypothetical protein [Streptomyces orinoci]|uniref:Uncharacterized protein n=1 Tax=Streptomyces orinoci TaxID=67339 RepID=A0ABV3JW85_STRON|nr:hypothetical protein [Streptomyces orinoci]
MSSSNTSTPGAGPPPAGTAPAEEQEFLLQHAAAFSQPAAADAEFTFTAWFTHYLGNFERRHPHLAAENA